MIALKATVDTWSWTETIQINRWLLKPIGVWPLSMCVSTTEKISSVILALISTLLMGFVLVPCALCSFLDHTSDLDEKVKLIGPLSFCMMSTMKYFILFSRGAEVTKCIQCIRFDWDQVDANHQRDDRLVMMENAKLGRSLAMFCAGFMYSGGFFYTVVMPLCGIRTEIIDDEVVRSQAFPIYRGLLDPRTSPSFEIVQFVQCLAGFVLYSISVGSCSLAAVFVMHACGQFGILKRKLDKLVNGDSGKRDSPDSEQRIGDIVEHHLRILSFITQIEELLNEICFIEFIGCTLNICFLIYYMLTEWEQSELLGTVTYCTFLASLVFNIFILCFIGELLSEQCRQIGLSAYMIDWYRLPGKEALGLILIFAVSNTSTKLTAGKLIELSLASFCGVLKSSMAYLSLLRTLTT